MDNSEVVYLYLDDIIPNRFQPREVFDDQALKELAVSIKEHGVIQPIIVRKVENKYEIIAGERRYKASTMAGLTKIPAIIKNLDDKESSKVALIENLQRKDLSPIEEARTYQKILELEENMTQEELAATMGKTQSSVSNKLRLLELPEEIQDALLKEKISERHARSLLTIEDKNDQIKLMEKVISEKLTVRDLEKEIKILKGEIPEEKTAQEAVIAALPPIEPIITSPPIAVIKPEEKPKEEKLDLEMPKPDLESFTTDGTNTSIETVQKEIGNTVSSEEKKESDDFSFEAKGEGTSENSGFASFFDSNTDQNNVAQTMDNAQIAVSSLETKDLNKAVLDIKNTIIKLQSNGYKVSFEESDNLNDYKISIQIDKN